ncbi:hypothetical protein HYW17_00515 [Candidatus Uhrbacteria bacterium]|nr:hypothetical protein [Candidatus Uhrbacteria bacterium]
MRKRIKNEELRMKELSIQVDGETASVRYGRKKTIVQLKKRPLLRGIAEVVDNAPRISSIAVRIASATFSGTRQVIATVNTLARGLGIKVNGKKQMNATYSAEPNITKPPFRAK